MPLPGYTLDTCVGTSGPRIRAHIRLAAAEHKPDGADHHAGRRMNAYRSP
jgi:hypothetical protein